MNKKFAAFIAVACILAALGAAGSIAYRVASASASGVKAAEADFQEIGSLLTAARTASDLGDAELRGRLAAHFSASPSILAVEVFERGVGTRWRMPSDSPYPLGSSGGESRLPSSTVRLSAPLRSDTTGRLAVDALYVRVTQLSVFTAFRDALIALAAFLALASIVMAIASRPRKGSPSEEAAEAASAAAAYQYETLSSGWEAMASEAPGVAAALDRGRVAPDAESSARDKLDREEASARAFEESFNAPKKNATVYEEPTFEEPVFEEPTLDASAFEEPAQEAPEPTASEPMPVSEPEPEPATRPAKSFFDEKEEDEFDIPEIDFKEDDRPRPSAFEAKIDEPLPDMEMPSDDWMSGSESLGASETPSEKPAPPASGLGPEGRLAGRLAAEISRAAASRRDLSVLRIEHEELTPAVPEYAAFAEAIKEAFDVEGLAFERGRSGFAVILPGFDSARALETAQDFFKKLDFLSGGDSGELEFLPLFIGISSRAGRPIAADTLLAEADAALGKAREDSESHIVAFKPDPERYKKFLASREG